MFLVVDDVLQELHTVLALKEKVLLLKEKILRLTAQKLIGSQSK